MNPVTVDAVQGIVVDREQCGNELITIQTLSLGLRRIADNVKMREMQHKEITKDMVHSFQLGGKYTAEKSDLALVACFFHWFGTSICNLARLVGFVKGLTNGDFTRVDLQDASKFEKIQNTVDGYVSSIPELAPVLVWRHKVSAHFAITAPRKSDNIATLGMSVVFPVTQTNGVYAVGEMTMTMTSASGVHVSGLPRWSITEVFETLIPRYWPNMTVQNPLADFNSAHKTAAKTLENPDKSDEA